MEGLSTWKQGKGSAWLRRFPQNRVDSTRVCKTWWPGWFVKEFSIPTKTQLSNFLGTPGEDYFKGNPKSLSFYFLVIWWGKFLVPFFSGDIFFKFPAVILFILPYVFRGFRYTFQETKQLAEPAVFRQIGISTRSSSAATPRRLVVAPSTLEQDCGTL